MAWVGIQRGEAGRIIAAIPYDPDRVAKMGSVNEWQLHERMGQKIFDQACEKAGIDKGVSV